MSVHAFWQNDERKPALHWELLLALAADTLLPTCSWAWSVWTFLPQPSSLAAGASGRASRPRWMLTLAMLSWTVWARPACRCAPSPLLIPLQCRPAPDWYCNLAAGPSAGTAEHSVSLANLLAQAECSPLAAAKWALHNPQTRAWLTCYTALYAVVAEHISC